ncbi:MAG: DUF6728 family protein [Cytophagaceae bacterium]
MNWKEYFKVGEVFTYYFRKADPNNKPSTNLRIMHGINKLSILMFLVAVVVLLYRAFLR